MTVESPSPRVQPADEPAPERRADATTERFVSPDEYRALLLSRRPLRREFARPDVLVDRRHSVRYRLVQELGPTTEATPAP